MTLKEAKKLHSGDEVFWNDPDDGACSRTYTIQKIELHGDDVVRIVDVDGSVLEAFLGELS